MTNLRINFVVGCQNDRFNQIQFMQLTNNIFSFLSTFTDILISEISLLQLVVFPLLRTFINFCNLVISYLHINFHACNSKFQYELLYICILVFYCAPNHLMPPVAKCLQVLQDLRVFLI